MKSLPERALLIRAPYIEMVLAGTKTWEIRSTSANIRGPIALIRSQSGLVVGTCELVDVKGPLRFRTPRQRAEVGSEALRSITGGPSPLLRLGAAEAAQVPHANPLPASFGGHHLGQVDAGGAATAPLTFPVG